MNSATVTNNNSYFMNVTSKGANSKSNKGQDFTQVMGKAANTETAADSSNAVQKKLNQVFIEKTKENAMNDRVQEKAPIKDVSADNHTDEAITDKALELLEKVAEKLGVSEEEIAAAMEALGMQMADLFNSDNMAQLVLTISGETDMMALITNGELYDKLTDLLQTVETALSELQQDLSVPPEELADMIEENKPPSKQVMPEVTVKDTRDLLTDEVLTAIDETTDAVNKTGTKTGKDAAVDAEAFNSGRHPEGSEVKQAAIVEVFKEPADRTQKNQQTQMQAQSETTDIEKPLEVGTEQNTAQEDTGRKDSLAENNQSFMQGLMNKTAAAAAQALEAFVPLGKAETESIMKQMMDYMKLHVSSNVTEMEIQLQPANLGNINLQVATKNGIVTAQLTTETEAVKRAIESQVVQLRESLNEQGIKIEAVEVTIASHEFERNLDQGAQSGQSKETDQSKKAGRRRIVLDEMDEETEAGMEETDKIQVQMMKQNGNSVSLMA